MKMRTALIVFCLLFGLCGCQNTELVLEENKSVQLENTELQRQVKQLAQEKQELQKQIITLAELNPDARIENIITVEKIELAKRTGVYDKGRNEKDNKLIVYLRTIDKFGDSIKGAGSVDVELWNLNLDGDKAKLKSWHITPSELKENWSGSLMTNYHRLVFDAEDLADKSAYGLTLTVKFVDYLTGKVLTAQKIVKISSQ